LLPLYFNDVLQYILDLHQLEGGALLTGSYPVLG
jgi:hypothetical protein